MTMVYHNLKRRIHEQEKSVVQCREALRVRARQGESRIRRQLTSPTTLVTTFLAGVTVGLLRGSGRSQPTRSPNSVRKVLTQLGGMLSVRIMSYALQSLFADPGENLRE